MNLTFDETANLISTFNSWYLLEHDSYLNSQWSENRFTMEIPGFRADALSDEVIQNLKDYTDFFNPKEDSFHISFVFEACDHQAREIFDALSPVLDKAHGKKILITNTMEFTQTDIYNDPEVIRLKNEIHELAEKHGAETIPEKEKEKEKTPGENIYKLSLEGIIENNGEISSVAVLFQDGPFPSFELFSEASRLFSTIKYNFEPPKGVAGTNPFECRDEEEAKNASRLLGETTDFRPRLARENILETGASPEELAAVITYLRYKDSFSLFANPDSSYLQLKRKADILATRQSLHRSCQMLLFLLLGVATVLYLWLTHKGK